MVLAKTEEERAKVQNWARDAGLLPRQRRKGGGRKPVLDQARLERLDRLLQANRAMTADELAAAYTAETGTAVGKSTVAKAMKDLGYHKVKLKRPPSTPAPQSPPRHTEQHRREPTAQGYPSALTDREWEVLEPLLAKRDGRGRPSKHTKRQLFDAVFYQARTGTQWRYLPKDFPPWPAVWAFFWRARDSGLYDRMLDALVVLWRRASDRDDAPTAGIVDSQTAKTTEKGGFAAKDYEETTESEKAWVYIAMISLLTHRLGVT